MRGPDQLRDTDPELASAWLATSRQKQINSAKVQKLLRAMQCGEWNPALHVNEPICLAAGRLRNGNHRLRALIEHGETVPMWVREYH